MGMCWHIVDGEYHRYLSSSYTADCGKHFDGNTYCYQGEQAFQTDECLCQVCKAHTVLEKFLEPINGS
jgi:hypothetical protein